MSLQQSQLDSDDPTASYMLQVWSFFSFPFVGINFGVYIYFFIIINLNTFIPQIFI